MREPTIHALILGHAQTGLQALLKLVEELDAEESRAGREELREQSPTIFDRIDGILKSGAKTLVPNPRD